jgi:hypothetical protein
MSPPAAGAAARTGHAPASPPLRLPPPPRRLSGPSRHPRAAAATRPAASPGLVVALIDHPWLERLVRGRAWIAIVAAALLGIVAMQVALLRLGAQIGNATSAVNALTARNETTRTEIAVLESSRRLSASSATGGFVYPSPGTVTYLQVNPGDAARAVREMTPPSAAAIAAAAAAAHDIASTTPTTPAVTTTVTPSTTSAGAATATTTNAATTPATGATGATAATTAAGGAASTASTPAGTAASGTAAASGASAGAATSTGTTAGATAATTPTTPTTATTSSGAASAPSSTAAGGTTPAG